MRGNVRYNHITIGLRCHLAGKWRAIRAHDWNTVGFNFYSDVEIGAQSVLFKQGAEIFEGELLWSSLCTDDEINLAMVLNKHLYKFASTVAHQEGLHARLLRLIRSPGKIDEKRQVLTALGSSLDDTQLRDMILGRQEFSMFRYGTRIDAPAWTRIVEQALSVSAVVLSLEKVTEAFASKKF